MDFSKLKFFIDTIREASNVLSMLMVKPSLKYDEMVNCMASDSTFASVGNDPEKWCADILNRLKTFDTNYLKYDVYETKKEDMREKMQKYNIILQKLNNELERCGFFDAKKYGILVCQTSNNDAKSNVLIPKLASVFYQLTTNISNLNALFDELQENIKKMRYNPNVDKRRNVRDFFKDTSRIDEVRKDASDKTGATLVSVFMKYIENGTLETFPPYGSLVKDWDFPDDDRLENNYKQAKKNKL